MTPRNVFVYGSLKRGFANHRFVARSKFLGPGVTPPRFAMLDLGAYPGVIRGATAVAGEVWAVSPAVLARLDQLEDNGRIYSRELVPIALPSGSVDAWLYVFLLDRRHRKGVTPRRGVVTWREPPTA
jgi:gamma-glutamylaminecyclotransferase